MIRLADIRSIHIRSFAAALPLALAASLAVSSAVVAQAPPAPAPAKPAVAAPSRPPPRLRRPSRPHLPRLPPAMRSRRCSASTAIGAPIRPTPNGRKGVLLDRQKPKSAQITPPGRKRDQAYVFISTRPAENVKNEVSVIIGYPFKASSDATAEIGTTKFAMYTQNDGAWIKNVAEEARMIEAMRKGSDLTVKGVSTAPIDRPIFAQGPEPGARPRHPGMQVSPLLSRRTALLLPPLVGEGRGRGVREV